MADSVSITEVNKRFGSHEVVKSLSFSVKQGIIFALLGVNGAGKTTTIHMITTLLKKSSGGIMVEGLDIDFEENEIKRKIGIVFQEDVLDSSLTVSQNLYYRGGFYTKTNRELKKRIHEIVRQLQIEPLMEREYGTLSGGERRIVQIARALLTNPKLLILDEPTAGLDPVMRKRVWRLLKELNKKRKLTILYTTHYMEEVAYADKVGVMQEGKLLLGNEYLNLMNEKGFYAKL